MQVGSWAAGHGGCGAGALVGELAGCAGRPGGARPWGISRIGRVEGFACSSKLPEAGTCMVEFSTSSNRIRSPSTPWASITGEVAVWKLLYRRRTLPAPALPEMTEWRAGFAAFSIALK